MWRGSYALFLGTSLAVGVGLFAVSTAGAQDVQNKDGQPQQQAPQPKSPQAQPPQMQPQQAPSMQGPQQSQQPAPPQPAPQQQAQQQGPQQDLDQMWRMQQAQLRARMSGAVQQLRTACQDELRNFCSTVTPGQGRLLLCMEAHADQISPQCELALLDTSRAIGKAVRHLDDVAQACWQDIQARCAGSGGSVLQCMVDNRASLSATCRAMITAAVPGAKGQMQQQAHPSLMGVAIYSADGMMLGEVTGVKRRQDGHVEAIEADLGSPLGIGATSVSISPDDLRWSGDHMELQMLAEQVRSVLQGQRR